MANSTSTISDVVKEDTQSNLLDFHPKHVHLMDRFFLSYREPIMKRKVNPLNFLFYGLIIIILIGSLFLWLPISHRQGINVSYIDALFTATSATTVTGLSTVDTFDTFNFFGQFIIFMMINIGGLGYMTIISFFFLSGNMFSMRYVMFMKESLNLPSIGDIFKVAKRVFFAIITFEAIGAAILTIIWSGKGILEAAWLGIFHSASAFNNAGFDLMGNFSSLTAYSHSLPLNIVIMSLIFVGGIGFIVISDVVNVLRGIKKNLSLHTKIVLSTSLILIVLGALGFFFFEQNNSMKGMQLEEKSLVSLFQSVTSRTAGFATIDLSKIGIPAIILLCILMFIGASPGSTGSGIKTTTFAVIVLWIISELKNKDHPEAFSRKIPSENLDKALLLFVLAIITVGSFTILISFIESFPLENIAFEVFSAFGTVGLSTGITPHLHIASKAAIVLLMFIGRMTPLALIELFSRPDKSKVKCCEERIAIG